MAVNNTAKNNTAGNKLENNITENDPIKHEETVKKRNYRYDSVRGLCMFLIVLQHFTFKGGFHFTDNAGSLIYVGIDIFVMQAFFFLSGLFSKTPEKNRDKLFPSLLWPVIIVGMIYWPLYILQCGAETAANRFQDGALPYAMWFLVVLFFYRYFQKYYAKIPHLLAFALFLYLISGIFEPLSMKGFAISRACTFFISFVMGYLVTMNQVERACRLKLWQMIPLGLVLISITVATVYLLPPNIAEAIKLNASFRATGLLLWEGLLGRALLLIVSTGWILFLLNLFSAKKGFWAQIGMNTMPIYIFHLFLAGLFKVKGFSFGYYDFKGQEALYLLTLFLVSLATTILLSTKPAQKTYSLLMDKTYSLAVTCCRFFRRR